MNDQERAFWERQKERWSTVPFAGVARVKSSEALEWPDRELTQKWHRANVHGFKTAEWYLTDYAERFKGKDVLDIGPGIGLDGVYLAQHGAHMHFADIVPDNLKLLERICDLKRIKAHFFLIDDPFRVRFPIMFDAIMAVGMVHHAPFAWMKREMAEFTYYLKPGGTVALMAYPKERWVAASEPDFEKFGTMTDGPGTPWAEWYDGDKMLALFGDNFTLNWWRVFGNDKFAWFDLTKERGGPPRYEGPRG